MTNVCMKHIYEVVYDLSVYLATLYYPRRLNQGHIPLKELGRSNK